MVRTINPFFRDDDMEGTYIGGYQDRALCPNKRVELYPNFMGFSWAEELLEKEYEPLLELREAVYPRICRIFISNIVDSKLDADNAWVKIWWKGNTIEVTSHLVNDILGLRNEGLKLSTVTDWKTCTWMNEAEVLQVVTEGSQIPEHDRFRFGPLRKMQLDVDKQILEDIIQGIIVPRGGHVAAVTKLDTVIIFCIMRKLRINLGHIIISLWINCHNHSTQNISHGMVITKILSCFGESFDDEEDVIKEPELFDADALRRRGLMQGPDGKWSRRRRREDIPQQQQIQQPLLQRPRGPERWDLVEKIYEQQQQILEQQATTSSRVNSMFAQVGQLIGKVNTISTNFESFREEFTRIQIQQGVHTRMLESLGGGDTWPADSDLYPNQQAADAATAAAVAATATTVAASHTQPGAAATQPGAHIFSPNLFPSEFSPNE